MKFRYAQIGGDRKTLAQLTAVLEAFDRRFKAKPDALGNPKPPKLSTAAETAMKVVMAMKSSAAVASGRARPFGGNGNPSPEPEPDERSPK